ncbi:MAG: hypothetical protein FJX25_10270 [Alphaproteobacteria bacterium]|nr:hypothetical protein [Alphaproteobacteria bacterium]
MTNPLITRLIEAVAAYERPGATKEQRKAMFAAEAELQKFVDALAAYASRAADLEAQLTRIGRETCGTGRHGESLRVVRDLVAEGGAA